MRQSPGQQSDSMNTGGPGGNAGYQQHQQQYQGHPHSQPPPHQPYQQQQGFYQGNPGSSTHIPMQGTPPQQQQQQQFYGAQQPKIQTDNFQFYQSDFTGSGAAIGGYGANPTHQPSMYQMQMVPVEVSFLAAFGTGGLPGEAPLLEELGINVKHIWQKSVAALNPLRPISSGIMDDTDLWGPFLFCMAFGIFLLLSGKLHFSYIYGVAALGWCSLYALLNLMSEQGADMYRTASVLGYCLLPMVILSSFSALLRLRGLLGYGLGIASILWCTYSSSSIFVTILNMKNQRILVAYPVGLFYACFALITIF